MKAIKGDEQFRQIKEEGNRRQQIGNYRERILITSQKKKPGYTRLLKSRQSNNTTTTIQCPAINKIFIQGFSSL